MKSLFLNMKKNIVLTSIALLFEPAISLANTEITQKEHNGVIHFTGAIIHPPCRNGVDDLQLTINCLNDKADMTQSTLDLKKIAHSSNWVTINDGRGEYIYNWVDQNKQMGLLTIKYI